MNAEQAYTDAVNNNDVVEFTANGKTFQVDPRANGIVVVYQVTRRVVQTTQNNPLIGDVTTRSTDREYLGRAASAKELQSISR